MQADLSADLPPDGELASRVNEQFKILGQQEPPNVKPGKQCTDPVTCEFFLHCNPEVPPNHISYLPGVRSGKIEKLEAMAIDTIDEIPDDFPLTERQQIVRECVRSKSRWIAPDLEHALAGLKYPLCFMDFETLSPALPWFRGMRPYDQIPFQWSVHRREAPGAELTHHEFLATTRDDPRGAFAESLLRATEGARTVVVYNRAFEAGRLDDLARWLPGRARNLKSLAGRLFDLLPVVRENVYDPGFLGSYSLKQVLPVLVPGMSYDGLKVRAGEQAGLAWLEFLQTRDPDLEAAMRAYCAQDSLALVRVLEALRCCALR